MKSLLDEKQLIKVWRKWKISLERVRNTA